MRLGFVLGYLWLSFTSGFATQVFNFWWVSRLF